MGEHQYFHSWKEDFYRVRQGWFSQTLLWYGQNFPQDYQSSSFFFVQFQVCQMQLLIGLPGIQRVARECFPGGLEQSHYSNGEPHCKLNNLGVLFTHFSLLWVWLSWVSLSASNLMESQLWAVRNSRSRCFPQWGAGREALSKWYQSCLQPRFLPVTDSHGISERSILGLL